MPSNNLEMTQGVDNQAFDYDDENRRKVRWHFVVTKYILKTFFQKSNGSTTPPAPLNSVESGDEGDRNRMTWDNQWEFLFSCM